MSERERVPTRNFRSPIMEIPAGTRLESPTGLPCRVVGRSVLIPGRITVVFEPPGGGEMTQHLWPGQLRGFRMDGGVL